MESNVLCIDEADMEVSKTKTLGPKLGGPPDVGVGVGVGIDDGVAVGVGEVPPSTSRQFTWALSLPVGHWMVMVPVVEAEDLNRRFHSQSPSPALVKLAKLIHYLIYMVLMW